MSAEDQYGRSLKVARRAFLKSQERLDKALEDSVMGSGALADLARNAAILAQAEETARLADEQRTANLIALVNPNTTFLHGRQMDAVVGAIIERMGIDS